MPTKIGRPHGSTGLPKDVYLEERGFFSERFLAATRQLFQEYWGNTFYFPVQVNTHRHVRGKGKYLSPYHFSYLCSLGTPRFPEGRGKGKKDTVRDFKNSYSFIKKWVDAILVPILLEHPDIIIICMDSIGCGLTDSLRTNRVLDKERVIALVKWERAQYDGHPGDIVFHDTAPFFKTKRHRVENYTAHSFGQINKSHLNAPPSGVNLYNKQPVSVQNAIQAIGKLQKPVVILDDSGMTGFSTALMVEALKYGGVPEELIHTLVLVLEQQAQISKGK